MGASKTKNFLIRNMPIELYNLLEDEAKAHHRSRNQEAIFALNQGLSVPPRRLKKPKPFKWGKKISSRFIYDAIESGRE